MLQHEPRARPTAEEALCHVWLRHLAIELPPQSPPPQPTATPTTPRAPQYDPYTAVAAWAAHAAPSTMRLPHLPSLPPIASAPQPSMPLCSPLGGGPAPSSSSTTPTKSTNKVRKLPAAFVSPAATDVAATAAAAAERMARDHCERPEAALKPAKKRLRRNPSSVSTGSAAAEEPLSPCGLSPRGRSTPTANVCWRPGCAAASSSSAAAAAGELPLTPELPPTPGPPWLSDGSSRADDSHEFDSAGCERWCVNRCHRSPPAPPPASSLAPPSGYATRAARARLQHDGLSQR